MSDIDRLKKNGKATDNGPAMLNGAVLVNDLMMLAEEDPLSVSQARAYQRELQFAKTFSLLLSEDGINPKDFDEELEIEYGCKLDDVFKVCSSSSGAIKFVIPSNLSEARAMLQAKYQAILKAPLLATGKLREDSQVKNDSTSQANSQQSILSDTLTRSDTEQKKRSPSVKRTYGRSTQNAAAASDDTTSPPMKRLNSGDSKATANSESESTTDPLKFSTLSEIEAYFYATMKGSESYTEAKADYRFECCVCNELFDENVSAILHLYSHLWDSVGSTAARCSVCYKWFPSEPDLSRHMTDHSANSPNVCRICDCEPFTSITDLASHMQTTHVRREMPYACRLCGYRSSLYSDVVEHFSTFHAGSAYAQCAYCLQVYQLRPPNTGGPCKTTNFFEHISRHQKEKEPQANCFRCRLSFMGFGDLPRHEKLEHQPGSSLHCVTRFPSGSSSAPNTSQTRRTPQSTSRNVDLSRLVINLPATSSTNGPALCRECLQPMAKKSHFGVYATCTAAPACPFSSACTFAMANHVQRHRRQQNVRPGSTAPPLAKPLHCQCGFSSAFGAIMAAHLLSCPSGCRTCSTTPPDTAQDTASSSNGAAEAPSSQAV